MAVAAREGRLDVAGLQDVPLLLDVVGPDAGEEVGLELEADRQLVGLGLVDPALEVRILCC